MKLEDQVTKSVKEVRGAVTAMATILQFGSVGEETREHLQAEITKIIEALDGE